MGLEPAISIIATLGGAANLAREVGVTYSQVCKWTWPKKRGGTGGLIPQRHHVRILDIARAKDKPLTASDFLPRANIRPSVDPALTESVRAHG